MKTRVKIFLAAEYIACISFFLYLYQMHSASVSLLDVVFFVITLLVSNNISSVFNARSGVSVFVLLPVLLPAIILLGPFWAAVIALIGSSEIIYRSKFIWYQFFFNRCMFFIAAGASSLVFQYSSSVLNMPFFTLPLLLALLVYFFINTGLVFLVVRLSSGGNNSGSPITLLSQLSKNIITSYFLGLLLYYSYITFGKIFFIMAILLVYTLKDFLASRIQQINAFTQIVESFLKVIDSKDHYTESHCKRVADYTETICKALGLTQRKTESIVNMAKIHDIGKIYVHDYILKSSSLLTDVEYAEMKKHSRYGYQLLQDIDILSKDLEIILYHHERYDGGGYPEGRKQKEIPLGSRIMGVCDAVDVMVTGRQYKPAMTKEQVITELEQCSAKQFDPEVAAVMINLIRDGYLDDHFKEDETINGVEV